MMPFFRILSVFIDANLSENQLNILYTEVKSRTKGSMLSLRIFMKQKNSSVSIRTSLEDFSVYGNIHAYSLYTIKNLSV